jgi:hypothetical protein
MLASLQRPTLSDIGAGCHLSGACPTRICRAVSLKRIMTGCKILRTTASDPSAGRQLSRGLVVAEGA